MTGAVLGFWLFLILLRIFFGALGRATVTLPALLIISVVCMVPLGLYVYMAWRHLLIGASLGLGVGIVAMLWLNIRGGGWEDLSGVSVLMEAAAFGTVIGIIVECGYKLYQRFRRE